MKSFYQDRDIDCSYLSGKTISIIGYGNQGRPQGLNLRDSGINVIVGCRPGSAKAELAKADGLKAVSIDDAVREADVLMMLLPDEVMGEVYTQHIAPHSRAVQYLGFGHGMAIHAGWITPKPDLNVFLLAPKGQGRGVRNNYLAGSGVPGLVAVHQDPSGDTLNVALAYGKAIGCARTGILPTTFKDETVCDLFSEQTILCGGLTSLIKTGFEVLVENGYDPRVAYFECLYEVKLIADLLQAYGINETRSKISSTALFGDISQGPRVIDGHVRENMQRVLDNIESGTFAQSFLDDVAQGRPKVREQLLADNVHQIEDIGHKLRELHIL